MGQRLCCSNCQELESKALEFLKSLEIRKFRNQTFVASFKNRKFWFRQNELAITCLVRWSLDLSCSSDVKHFKSNSKMSTLSEDIKPPINTVNCCFIHHGLHKRKITWRPWRFGLCWERTAGLNRCLAFWKAPAEAASAAAGVAQVAWWSVPTL